MFICEGSLLPSRYIFLREYNDLMEFFTLEEVKTDRRPAQTNVGVVKYLSKALAKTLALIWLSFEPVKPNRRYGMMGGSGVLLIIGHTYSLFLTSNSRFKFTKADVSARGNITLVPLFEQVPRAD